MSTFYCTNTILNDNTVIEDKGLYIDGLNHAKQMVMIIIRINENIKAVVLLPDNGSENITITRKEVERLDDIEAEAERSFFKSHPELNP